ncbi:MAG: hemolysin family protein [Phycisphaerales bacterium]|nr:hemolysin family protein [Phycisphaerales bacterium]
MFIGLIVLWSLFVLLFATAVMAIRAVSHTRLSAILKNRSNEAQLTQFFSHQHEYERMVSVYQQLCVILFVLTLFVWFSATEPWYVRSLYVLLISLPWLVLFGVGIPAGWARYAGDAFLARTLPLLEVLRKVSTPLLKFINALDEIVRRLSGAPEGTQDKSEQIELEIMDAVRHGETSGAVDATERAMIKSVMVLDETSVGEIMTPRTDMIGIDVDSDYEHVRELLVSKGYSRIPVYEESLDHIVGVLYAKDLLRIAAGETFSLRETMRDVTFVPETKDLASLLREFQANRVHITIVIDEYGGTAGLVTFEDILEELVGEITDEHEAPPVPPINRIDDKTAVIDARVRVDELNETLEMALPEDEAYDTVGGFIFSKLGRIPKVGECIVENGTKIEILEAEERSVSRLRIHRLDSVTQE